MRLLIHHVVAAWAPTRSWRTARTQVVERPLPGLLLCGLLAATGMMLGRLRWFEQNGLSALTLAIVLGMVVGNTVYPRWAAVCGPGAAFSKQQLLRLGIILYGLRLTVQDVAHVGVAGLLIDVTMLVTTFGLACLVGRRWLGLDGRTTILIGAGSAICGAAAVMATEPVIKARSQHVTAAVATVVIFGTVSIFLYPALYDAAPPWATMPGGMQGFGIFTGSTVHEVAQVIAAAKSVGPEAVDAAVIAKMTRVMMLAPFLLALSALWARSRREAEGCNAGQSPGITIPWFAFAFLATVLLNSLGAFPAAATALVTEVDTALLTMAMAALGVTTRIGALRQAGFKPLALALVLYAWLMVGGAFVNRELLRLCGV